MKITLYGAAREVTGSCILVETPNTRVLVDCGLFQGSSSAHDKNLQPFPFDPSSIDAVIMTHAHIDHIGRFPRLVKQGFSGRVFASHPTRLFTKMMWQDAAQVMKDEQRRFGKEASYLPKDIPAAYDLVHGVDQGTRVRISNDFSFQFRESGHIFGSGFVDAEVYGSRLVCSGDLGNDYTPILRPTARIEDADVVVTESTYGNRVHEDPQHRMDRLAAAVREVAADKGTLLIPAFSLERAQEVIYELNLLVESGKVPKLPTFLDSPLAIKALPVYKQFSELYDEDAASLKASGDDFFAFPGLEMTKKPEESRHIRNVPSPKIVIAGSGMMHGGRIMHHLADYLHDPKTKVLVIGYQSAGTVGRAILDGAQTVRIDGHEVEVHAKIELIGAYSAHADQTKLLKWVASGNKLPKRVILNHGEPEAQDTLAQLIRDTHGVDAISPQYGETIVYP